MLAGITVKNFKSITNLDLKLGQVTILIGENGSGKTNILEAIALGAAAANNKLDNEFLTTRGIRVTEPEFMRSAFDRKSIKKEITIKYVTSEGKEATYYITNKNEPYSQWEEIVYIKVDDKKGGVKLQQFGKDALIKALEEIINKRPDQFDLDQLKKGLGIFRDSYLGGETCSCYENFIIYSPENSQLRNFQQEGQIIPLGRKGEGLFKLLKSFYSSQDQNKITELKERLKLFDWFKDFKIPGDLFKGENIMTIFDRYIFDDSRTFDQRNMSEGFLYTLFYFILFISEKTPRFFAIENIETALNPKLCTKISETLISLAKKYNKQVIITTHNPAILDGLNLDDDTQRLFVVYRNKDGHTTVNRYFKPEPIEGVSPVKLSEAFLRGYLGGLPKNFSL